MFYPNQEAVSVEMLPGVVRRTLATSDGMMLVEVTLGPGAEVPRHAHPHDQVGIVVSGRMRMMIDEETVECGPGDSYHAPPDVVHSGMALELSVVIDVFSPPREDYA